MTAKQRLATVAVRGLTRVCALTRHRIGRVPDRSDGLHFNFWDTVTGEAVYNWTCACGHRFLSTGRWDGFTVERNRGR